MLAEFLKDYLPIIVFLLVALVLSVAFVAINYLASPKNPDPEKLSAYECGFEPFNDSRMEFDVRFYLVAILFIIFDLEIAFLFPGQGSQTVGMGVGLAATYQPAKHVFDEVNDALNVNLLRLWPMARMISSE